MSISISAMTQVIIPKEPTEFDILILELTAFLVKKLGNNIVRVEKISGWDGSNVRIVIRSLDYLERVLDAIENFEREKGILGTIAPEVLTLEEYMFISRENESLDLDDSVFKELRTYLKKLFGDEIVRVEKISGWDGSNVRIVIRSLDYLERVLDAIESFEREKGILGTIAPEVVLIDEF